MSKVLIIIPAYNEAENIGLLLEDIQRLCPQYDILVVNDCSLDQTSYICKIHNVKVIDLPVNLGIGGAVQTGYKYAYYNNYDIAVQVDGDGQHSPAFIRALVNEIENGSDLCIGSRFIEKDGFQSTAVRRIGIKFFSKLIAIVAKSTVTDPTSGARACNKKVIDYFEKQYPKDYPEPETVVALLRRNFKVSEVPVVMQERKNGHSSITSMKSVYYMIKVTLAILIASISKETNEAKR